MIDTGAFDPRFPGIILKLRRDQFKDIFTDLYADYFATETVHNDPEAFFNSDLILKGMPPLRSMLVHEVRHLFDFYSTPWFSTTVEYRIKSFIGFFMFTELLKTQYREALSQGKLVLVPSPLSKFVRMSKDARQASIKHALGQLSILGVDVDSKYVLLDVGTLPDFSNSKQSLDSFVQNNPDTLHSFICTAVSHYEYLYKSMFTGVMLAAPTEAVGANMLLEYLALSMQIDDTKQYDELATLLFAYGQINKHPIYQHYLNFLGYYEKESGYANIPFSALCAWAMSGVPEDADLPWNPSTRFVMALNAIVEGKIDATNTDPVYRLDTYFGTQPSYTSIETSLAFTSEVAKWLDTRSRYNPSGLCIKTLLMWFLRRIADFQALFKAMTFSNHVLWNSRIFTIAAKTIFCRAPALFHNGTIDRRMEIGSGSWATDLPQPKDMTYHTFGERRNHILMNATSDDISHWSSLYELFQIADHLIFAEAGNPKFLSSPNYFNRAYAHFGIRPLQIMD